MISNNNKLKEMKISIYNAIKSVPPVDALPFKAITVNNPYANPPKTMFNKISSNNGG